MAKENVREFKGGPGRRKHGPAVKIENPGKIIKRIFGFILSRYCIQYILVFICIIVSVLCSIQGTLFMKNLIDVHIDPMLLSGSTDFAPLLKDIGRVSIYYIVAIVASFIQQRILIYITQGVLRDMRNEMFEKMQKLPIRYFDTHLHGDIMSMYTNDTDTLRQMVSQSLPSLVQSVFTVLSVIVNMFILNWFLTLVALLGVFAMLMASKFLTGKSGKFFVEQQTDVGKVNGYIEEMMNGQRVVKSFCHEQKTVEEFEVLNNKLSHSTNEAHKFANILMPINAQISNVGFVITALVGSLLIVLSKSATDSSALQAFLAAVSASTFTPGSLGSFLTFTKQISHPINQISMQVNSVLMAVAGAQRIFSLLDEKPEVDDGYVTLVNAKYVDGKLVECDERTGLWAWKHYHKASDTTTFVELKGDIVFDDVTFGYTEDKMVLHDIDLFATPGQKIAFVGSTGAGKTTIINLINRFYEVADGKIRYDGINVNKIKKDDLRRSLGIVLQETHLFTGTVKENIRYGKLDATDEEVIKAAKLANAHSFIRHLPQGYDTMLEDDGSNLSQGQRQLLAIARAAIADPPALILDEATSSIDTHTESLVQKGMDKLMKGRTTFVIAHRLSTVRNSDCIMVLEQGRIIERGSHDELIEKKGKYYQLYTGKIVNT